MFEDFGNVKNYPLQAKPSSRQHFDLSDEELSHEDLQDLFAILSHEWTMEAEVAENVLRIDGASDSVHCQIRGRDIEALYNPIIGLNLISTSFIARNLPYILFIQ